MAAPYVSKRRLVGNSMSAMLSAIEIFNKPRITYRDEVTVVLVVNAYELLLKAVLRDAEKNVYYKKKRHEPYMTVSLDDCIKRLHNYKLWHGLDGRAIEANVLTLAEYRNRTIHLYNSDDLATLVYYLMQQAVINYRDLLLTVFGKDISSEMTWQLLPLGATAPPEDVSFLDPKPKRTAVHEAQDFIDHLRERVEKVEGAGGDPGRVVTVYDVHMRSVKKYGSSDLLVGVDQTSDGRIVFKDRDPRDTHPYSMQQLIDRANETGVKGTPMLSSYDYTVMCWKHDLKDDPKFAWKHDNQPSHLWSEQAAKWFAQLTEKEIDDARKEYRLMLQARRNSV